MRVLTIRQPFAGLLATGRMHVELRSRPTSHRGAVAIHAGLRLAPLDPPFAAAADGCEVCTVRGAVIGVVDLVECRPMRPEDVPGAAHPWEPDLWAWVMANARPLPKPIPRRGSLGLRELDADVARQVDRAIAIAAPGGVSRGNA